MSTVTAPTPVLAQDLTEGQVVKVDKYVGTVVSSGKAPRSRKWSVCIDVGGQTMDLRTEGDSPMLVVPESQLPQAHVKDHRPDFSGHDGTSCSCGFVPKNRPTRSSMWNVPFNAHRRSLGLMGI